MSYDVLLIGLGSIGLGYDLTNHDKVLTHAKAFNLHKDFKLIAAVDSDSTARDLFQKIYGEPAYSDVSKALNKHKPELVVIATPTDTHFELLMQVLEIVKPKVILCEKPLSYDIQQAKEMVDICNKKNVLLYVNYMRRSEPAAIEIKKRIESEHIGPTVKCVCWYSKGFLHNGSHFFNLLEFWFGNFKGFKILNRGRIISNSDAEPDLFLTFDRASVCMLAGWEEFYSHYEIEILAQNGRMRYQKGGYKVTWNGVKSDDVFKNYRRLDDLSDEIMNGMSQYQLFVVNEISIALSGSTVNLCSGQQALITQQNMDEILRSIHI